MKMKPNSKIECDGEGTIIYYQNNRFHRENGPAVKYVNGGKEWFQDGKRHREDGPACEYADGDKHWYIEGDLHREDGPAREYSKGLKEWYIKGKKYTEKEFLKKTSKKDSCEGKVVEVDGKKYKLNSKIECDSIGNIRYYQNNLLHREEGPAVEWCNGNKYWYKEGKKHRLNGPAVEYIDGTKFWGIKKGGYKEWWVDGVLYSEKEFLKKMSKQDSCDDKVVEIDGKKYKLVVM